MHLLWFECNQSGLQSFFCTTCIWSWRQKKYTSQIILHYMLFFLNLKLDVLHIFHECFFFILFQNVFFSYFSKINFYIFHEYFFHIFLTFFFSWFFFTFFMNVFHILCLLYDIAQVIDGEIYKFICRELFKLIFTILRERYIWQCNIIYAYLVFVLSYSSLYCTA